MGWTKNGKFTASRRRKDNTEGKKGVISHCLGTTKRSLYSNIKQKTTFFMSVALIWPIFFSKREVSTHLTHFRDVSIVRCIITEKCFLLTTSSFVISREKAPFTTIYQCCRIIFRIKCGCITSKYSVINFISENPTQILFPTIEEKIFFTSCSKKPKTRNERKAPSSILRFCLLFEGKQKRKWGIASCG